MKHKSKTYISRVDYASTPYKILIQKTGYTMKNKERKYFTAFDILIIFAVVIASVVTLVAQFSRNDSELTCVVKVKGEVVHSVELSEVNEPLKLKIDGEYPLSIYITDSGAKVVDATCPDKLCEHSKEITRSGQSIVCLPAKVSLTLKSETQQNEFDAVVR